MILNILGTEYELKKNVDPKELGEDVAGYCDSISRKIVIADIGKLSGGWSEASKEEQKQKEAVTIRHEIIHAYLDESGLQQNTHCPKEGWARNEEMVDWFAIMAPKIIRTFNEALALPKEMQLKKPAPIMAPTFMPELKSYKDRLKENGLENLNVYKELNKERKAQE